MPSQSPTNTTIRDTGTKNNNGLGTSETVLIIVLSVAIVCIATVLPCVALKLRNDKKQRIELAEQSQDLGSGSEKSGHQQSASDLELMRVDLQKSISPTLGGSNASDHDQADNINATDANPDVAVDELAGEEGVSNNNATQSVLNPDVEANPQKNGDNGDDASDEEIYDQTQGGPMIGHYGESNARSTHSKLTLDVDDSHPSLLTSSDGIAERENVQDEVVTSTDESGWKDWTAIQVSNWLYHQLEASGIQNDSIQAFIKEFETHDITGKSLQSMKENVQTIQDLRSEFENKSFGIWMEVEKQIKNLP